MREDASSSAEVSILVHLEQDVAASHKLAIEVHLRDCGPVGEVLHSCGRQVLVLQHVVRCVVVHSMHPEDLNHGVAEAAHGLCRRPLHEHHHFVLLHHLTKVFLEIRRCAQKPGRGRQHASVGLSGQKDGCPGPQTPSS
ncbi:hypothetical protein INR49_004411 [Caranx melampygus]|nr:hypothetical protein INR49_004411 [Caranx melampygus]